MEVSRERTTGTGLLKICLSLALVLMACVMFFTSKSGSFLFAALLERSAPPFSASQAKAAQAIVVLTGANASMLEAARLHRQTGLPVLASGGDGEAAAIKNHLEKSLCTPVKWTEGNSRNTEQNARFSADILVKAQVRRIILVTHALHIRRARAMFVDQGFEVIAAPTGFSARPELRWRDLLPSSEGRKLAKSAFHEVVGLAFYKLRFAVQ